MAAICASFELRLIIITNHKEVVLRRGQETHEAQLGGIDVPEARVAGSVPIPHSA
jgi:hypothetical protein